MKKRSNLAIMGKLVTLVRPLALYMFLAILLGVLGFLCATFLTIFGTYALLDAAGFTVPVTIGAAFTCLILFTVLRGLLRYGEQACNHFIAFKLLAHIRDKVFHALRRLCPAKLEGRDKGDLISIITSDIELLEVFYAHTISPIAIAICMSAIMVCFIGAYHPILGLIALFGYLTVGILLPCITSKKSGALGMELRTRSGELSSFVLDSLRGLPELIQYRWGDARLKSLEEQTDALAEKQEKQSRINGRNSAATNTVILLFDLAMLTAAALLYQGGAISFVGLVIPVVAMMSSFGPVIALANLGGTLQNTFAAGERVLDILEEKPQVEATEGMPATQFNGAQAEHVTFAYGDETILDDVTLPILENQIIGITGRSGSGKSTLLRLLMRFWDVKKGAIRISGREIAQINTSDLRQMESFVTQETHLFHDSILENIRLAKRTATNEEIIEACKKASLHDFIMTLPKGYDTPVGELGETLSGGERQRIGLARAFLHEAPFILLDEPTSNLDSLSEAVILRSLREERAGRTVVLVSHRASTMRITDRTYCVENGRMS